MAGVIWGGLVPHPPLIIPGIGQDEVQQVQKTVASMKAIAQEIKNLQPDNLVIISPHGPAFHDGIPVWDIPRLSGSFAQFGYPSLKYEVSLDRKMVDAVRKEAEKAKIPLVFLDDETIRRTGIRKTLDHGVMVPLHYLQEAGVNVPVVLVSIGWISEDEFFSLGKAIQKAAAEYGSRTAVLASGDLSHSLQESGPVGYHPAGKKFDESLKHHFETGQLEKVLQMDSHLINDAAECGYRPIVILLGSLSGLAVEPKVHSYEGPFGVGYMVASFPVTGEKHYVEDVQSNQDLDDEENTQDDSYVGWAKICLETYVKEKRRQPLPSPVPESMQKTAGVFVSIKKNGLLRGCIGTVFPAHDNLAEEIRENAISAGTKDPRFYPVTEAELPYLKYSVDILSEPEGVTDMQKLDPGKYGVIVRRGNNLGLLLPDLEGIDTVAEQLRIACQKAGIDPDAPYTIERFQVIRHE
jgi:MEMO1 family protein